LDADGLPHRIFWAEQVVFDGETQHAHLGRAGGFPVSEEAPRHQLDPADCHDLGSGAVDDGGPVPGTVNHLGHLTPHRGYGLHRGNVPGNGLGVANGQGGRGAQPHAQTPGRGGPGQDEQQIGPHAGDLPGHLLPGPGPQGYHNHHRAHSDDDPESSQKTPELVHPERKKRYLDTIAEFHISWR